MKTIYADTVVIADARHATARTLDRYFKGTDMLEETDHDDYEYTPIEQKQKKVGESYQMRVPSTAKELLQQYNTLLFIFEKGTIGTVRVGNQEMELSDVVTQGSLHKWNPELLPRTVKKLRMKEGNIQITLKQPVDITAEAKYWTGKEYTVLSNGDELLILKNEDALCTILGNNICVQRKNFQEYIKNMREI